MDGWGFVVFCIVLLVWRRRGHTMFSLEVELALIDYDINQLCWRRLRGSCLSQCVPQCLPYCPHALQNKSLFTSIATALSPNLFHAIFHSTLPVTKESALGLRCSINRNMFGIARGT